MPLPQRHFIHTTLLQVSTVSLSSVNPATRRNLWILTAAQSLGASSAPIIVALGGLVGQKLTPDPTLSTLPVSLYGIGVALSMIPVAILMRTTGRRATYLIGAMICVAAALGAATAIIQASFWLFCASTMLAGLYGACVQNYRFAASDMVEPAYKPNAISMIMVGGLAAAIIGPQMVIWTQDSWASAPFAGSFIGQAALAVLVIPLLWSLKLPPSTESTPQGHARPLMVIARTPTFLIAVLSGMVSYGLMSFIMTAAPLAMVHHGHAASDATLGIQWHILAMFGPSFFTGKLIARFGDITITAIGLMLLFSSGMAALSGMEVIHFWGSLILLGLGWNFGFIGATTLLTRSYRPSEKAKVQTLNDFLVFSTVAVASLGAGHQLNISGWYELNIMTFPVISLILVLLIALPWLEKQPAKAENTWAE